MSLTLIDRAAINRANASKSTGPKSEAGKQRSAMNAYRHGLTGQILLQTPEEMRAYNDFVRSFHDSHRPQGPDETQLVQTMADSSWQLNSCRAWQNLILRHQAYQGPAPLTSNHEQVADALAIAAVVARCGKDLNNFSLYESRQFRMYERAQDRLFLLQEMRRRREQEELEQAARLLHLHETEESEKQEAANGNPNKPIYIPKPYDPTDDGFVFSTAAIKRHLHRKLRLEEYHHIPKPHYAAA